MKAYSYNGDGYPKPSSDIFNDAWPVQFLPGFSAFYNDYHHNTVLLIHDEQSDAWLPLRIFSIKVFTFGQILHAPVKQATELTAQDQTVFFNRMNDFLRVNNICQRLMQPHPMGISLGVPQQGESCVFGTYINDLQAQDDEALLFTFDPKYRKAVQHSIKHNARVLFGREAFDDFYKLYTATTERAGIHRDPVEYFQSELKHLGDEHVDIGVVYDEQHPIGAVYMIWSRYAALCTHAGSGGVESKLYGGMKYLHYAMMLRMKARGVKFYDLVGVRINSSHPGLQGVFRFKKGFGGVLKTGFLWKADLKPLPMKLFDLMILVKQKGKKGEGDIIDQENRAPQAFTAAEAEENA